MGILPAGFKAVPDNADNGPHYYRKYNELNFETIDAAAATGYVENALASRHPVATPHYAAPD